MNGKELLERQMDILKKMFKFSKDRDMTAHLEDLYSDLKHLLELEK